MKRATITECRPVRPEDGAFLQACAWVSVDSAGRRFGGTSKADARERAEAYNSTRRARGANPATQPETAT